MQKFVVSSVAAIALIAALAFALGWFDLYRKDRVPAADTRLNPNASSPPARPSPVTQDYEEAMDALDYDNWGWSGEAVFPGFRVMDSMLSGVYPWNASSIAENTFTMHVLEWKSGELCCYSTDRIEGYAALANDTANGTVGVQTAKFTVPSHPDWKGTVTVAVYPTSKDAREALLAPWAYVHRPDPLLSSNAAIVPTLTWEQAVVGAASGLGDVNISNKWFRNADTGECSAIEFLRRNVIVTVSVSGTNPDSTPAVDALPAASALDSILESITPLTPDEVNGLRPVLATQYQRSHLMAESTSDILDRLHQCTYSISVSPSNGDYLFDQSEYDNELGRIVGMVEPASLTTLGLLDSSQPGTSKLIYLVMDKATLLVAVRIDEMVSYAR